MPNEEKTHDNDDGSVLYLYDIDTKYYSTQIAFCPLDSTENLDDVVKNNIEGIVLYIDAKDVSIEGEMLVNFEERSGRTPTLPVTFEERGEEAVEEFRC